MVWKSDRWQVIKAWGCEMYLVERNTAEICQALDNVWEGIQSVKSESHRSHQEQACKTTPPDNDHVSISGNPVFGLTWDSLPPLAPNRHNQHECKWTQPVLVSTGSWHATSTWSESSTKEGERRKQLTMYHDWISSVKIHKELQFLFCGYQNPKYPNFCPSELYLKINLFYLVCSTKPSQNRCLNIWKKLVEEARRKPHDCTTLL